MAATLKEPDNKKSDSFDDFLLDYKDPFNIFRLINNQSALEPSDQCDSPKIIAIQHAGKVYFVSEENNFQGTHQSKYLDDYVNKNFSLPFSNRQSVDRSVVRSTCTWLELTSKTSMEVKSFSKDHDTKSLKNIRIQAKERKIEAILSILNPLNKPSQEDIGDDFIEKMTAYTIRFKEEFVKYAELYSFDISLNEAVSKMESSLKPLLKFAPEKLKLEISADKSIVYTFKQNDFTLYIDHYLELDPEDDEEIIIGAYRANEKLRSFAGSLTSLEQKMKNYLFETEGMTIR